MSDEHNERVTRSLILGQVLNDQVEYAPGLWAWQMEEHVRDAFVEALEMWVESGPPLEWV